MPYAILEEFGLTQEMIEDLPVDVYRDILNGRLSPVLPISLKDKEGGTVSARARFKLVRDAAENADVIFHPRLVRTELDRYSPEEQEALRSGKAIISHAPDDPSTKCFVQIDTGTNQVIYVPTPVIGKNISHLMDVFELSSGEIQSLQDGDVVCINDEDEDVAIGIDLTEKSGIRLVLGTREKWRPRAGLHRRDLGGAAEGDRPQQRTQTIDAMKRKTPNCSHDELVQLRQDGLVMDLDFIMMHPDDELKEEFKSFCEAHDREMDEESASEFLSRMEEGLELGMECGDA